MNSLHPWRFGGAAALAFSLLYVACAIAVVLFPDGTIDFFRVHLHLSGGRPLSAYLLGLAFGFGWTPCIGPVLGAILTMSAVSSSVSAGVVLLAAYSLGLGIPFLAAALFTDRLVARHREVRRLGRILYVLAGAVMVITGLAMISSHLSLFAIWLLQTFPALGNVG